MTRALEWQTLHLPVDRTTNLRTYFQLLTQQRAVPNRRSVGFGGSGDHRHRFGEISAVAFGSPHIFTCRASHQKTQGGLT